MKLSKRKLLTIVTESILEDRLIRAIKKLGASGYTLTYANGEGSRGVRKGDWDQNRNIRIEIVCQESIATAIFDHLVENYYENYGMIIYQSDVEVMRPQKF